MKQRKNFISNLALGAIVLAFAATAFGQTESARRTQSALYGLHFLSAGQTARLSVVNPRFGNSEIIPCIRVRFVFDIYAPDSADPTHLRFVRRVLRELELDGGEAATFDFTATGRGEYVSPAVFIRPEEENPSEPVRLRALSTLVVREGGRTILNLPAVLKGFDPQPDPPTQNN